MKLLQQPVVLILLGLTSGLGTGLGWFQHAANTVAAAVLARHAALVEARKPAAPWGFWTIELENVASDLKEERARVQQLADQLAQRESRLKSERVELEKVRTEIEALRREFAANVVAVQADEAKNLRTLAQTYTSLSARGAVTIFRDMDDVTVVKILSLMKSESVAPIFEEMSRASASDPSLARRAAALSERLRVVRSTPPAGS
jgi:flagellar motility protein MotE (MotC chaperone)